LIDGGADVVYGHSSHHPRPFEIYHGKLILYGCGDLLNDYEGISGYEPFRDDLGLMYFPTIDEGSGRLLTLRMMLMQLHQFRLRRASDADVAWMLALLNRVGAPFGVRLRSDGAELQWMTGSGPDLPR
jgi:poly-gamma-glutamate synthesis protein (capsule biosynthesis protein)